jgi:hypothetical protein
MAAQVCFLACLLAICLPIIFVQAPRFEIFREKQAENEVEKRSTVLPRPPPLRRIKRLSLEAYKDIKGNGSEQDQEQGQEQEQSKLNEIARRRWNTRNPGPVFQGDASADSITSPHWTEELRRARAGKKPWDPPFRRQHPSTEARRLSQERPWTAPSDSSPPRKTGRDLEARGLAMRLFLQDSPREKGDIDRHDQYLPARSKPPQTPQEPLPMRRPSQSIPHDVPLQETPLKSSKTQSISPRSREPCSLPSPLDGSPLQSTHRLPQTIPLTKDTLKQAAKVSETPVKSPSVQILKPKVNKAVSDKPTNAAVIAPCEPSKPNPDVTAVNTNRKENRKWAMPLWQVLLLLMGLIIFVFAFAILVAHCLAWFLVYKTESRLGQVRTGLLRGGEMKLCLCSRG